MTGEGRETLRAGILSEKEDVGMALRGNWRGLVANQDSRPVQAAINLFLQSISNYSHSLIKLMSSPNIFDLII